MEPCHPRDDVSAWVWGCSLRTWRAYRGIRKSRLAKASGKGRDGNLETEFSVKPIEVWVYKARFGKPPFSQTRFCRMAQRSLMLMSGSHLQAKGRGRQE